MYKEKTTLTPAQLRILDTLIGDRVITINEKINASQLNLKSQFNLIKDIEKLLCEIF